ncbi:MAG: aldehyde dehydrogenase family protein [Chromatiales bacterium]|nr:aldehyde dehydrogenase family protein [Chromatiales bacterium]
MTETIKPVKDWKEGVGRVKMIINGEWADAGGKWLPVENPARQGYGCGTGPPGRAAEVDRAVAAAAEAFKSWKKSPARERGKALLKIADALEAEKEDFARLYSIETGNAIATQSRGEAIADGRPDPLLRRGGERNQGRGHPLRRAALQLHPPRAPGGGGRHRALERAARPECAQDCHGPHPRQHAGAKALRGSPAHRRQAGRALQLDSCPRGCSTWSPAPGRNAARR